MPHIVDPAQAKQCAEDQASLAADGVIEAEGAAVRRARCVKPDGSPSWSPDGLTRRENYSRKMFWGRR
jgi:hypothetical protein